MGLPDIGACSANSHPCLAVLHSTSQSPGRNILNTQFSLFQLQTILKLEDCWVTATQCIQTETKNHALFSMAQGEAPFGQQGKGIKDGQGG